MSEAENFNVETERERFLKELRERERELIVLFGIERK